MQHDTQSDSAEWFTARKRPVTVQARGPYTDPDTLATLEGDFEIDQKYVDEHGGYYIIRGIEGEEYPCGADIFERTHDVDCREGCDECGSGGGGLCPECKDEAHVHQRGGQDA